MVVVADVLSISPRDPLAVKEPARRHSPPGRRTVQVLLIVCQIEGDGILACQIAEAGSRLVYRTEIWRELIYGERKGGSEVIYP